MITCLESADVSSLGLPKHDFERELRNRNKMRGQPFFYDEWFKCNKIFSENIGILLMSAKSVEIMTTCVSKKLQCERNKLSQIKWI